MKYRVSELAARFNLEFRGDGEHLISGVGTLADANSTQISFLANKKYTAQLPLTKAGAVVLGVGALDSCKTTALIAPDPYVAYARIAALFEPLPVKNPGIHPTAVVAEEARVSATACIGPYCVIEAGAVIEDGVVLGPYCSVGANCIVGAGSRLISRVSLVARVTLGKRVIIHPGAVIGADGFGIAFDKVDNHWIKVPQLGGVRIGDDCEIGANTTVDCGALGDTVLEEDVRLDNQIQIGHNVCIGAHTVIAGCSGIAGSTKVGKYCVVAGHVGIAGHLEIVDHVAIKAKSGVAQSILEAGEYSSGMPVLKGMRWRKNVIRFQQLDEYMSRLTTLEKKVNKNQEEIKV